MLKTKLSKNSILFLSIALSMLGFAFSNTSKADNSGTVNAWIQCYADPVYDPFDPNRIIGYNTRAVGGDDHGNTGSITGGPSWLGPSGGNYVYTYTVPESPSTNHAGTLVTCSEGVTPPPQELPPPPPSPLPPPTPNPPPPPTPLCPDPSITRVFLSPASIEIGQTSIALAPSGWINGTFKSNTPSVATIGAATSSTSATVNGVGIGTSLIEGEGWLAPNGATNCRLGGNFITVTEGPTGGINADPNPIQVCIPITTGVTNISAFANTFANVEVFGAQGITDGTVLFTVSANVPNSSPTGNWVKNGTVFKLVAPYSGNREIARVTLALNSRDCSETPPPPNPNPPPPNPNPPPPAPNVPWAAVYNTNTVPPEHGPVTCGRLLAVWENLTKAGIIDGYRIYNEDIGRYIELKNPSQSKHEFDPLELGVPNPETAYTYSVASFRGSTESSHTPAGTVAPITNCGKPDLTPSNKDISKIGNIPLSYEPTNAAADANFTAESLPIRDNMSIEFAINLVNGGQQPITDNITVVDTMYNLHIPTGNVNATVLCNNECRLIQQSYDAANRKITFIVAPKPNGSLDTNEAWTILYSARTIAPRGITGSVYRFQNTASLGFPSEILKTRHVPVLRDLGIPNIYEIQ